MKFLCAIVFSACCFSQTLENAASGAAGLAPGALTSLYANGLTTVEAATDADPPPLRLGGVQIEVTDSQGVKRPAAILFVSPTQVNFEIPPQTATGEAAFEISGAKAPVTVRAEIHRRAPALFALNRSDMAAATAVRVVFPSLDKFPVSVYHCAEPLGSTCELTPIAQSADSTLYVSLYATGLGEVASLADLVVNVGDQRIAPTYAGPQLDKPGEERIDFPLPKTAHGDLKVSVTVEGVTSNAVRIRVR